MTVAMSISRDDIYCASRVQKSFRLKLIGISKDFRISSENVSSEASIQRVEEPIHCPR